MNYKKFENKDLQITNQSDKLAIIAGVITTFGDALATLATILAVEESAESNDGNNDYYKLKKQVEYLMIEQEKLKKQLDKK